MSGLPQTPTNTGRTRRRRGVGELFTGAYLMPLSISGGVSMVLVFALFVLGEMTVLKFGLCFLPLILVGGWVMLFVMGKPPHYQDDLFEEIRAKCCPWLFDPELTFNTKPLEEQMADMGHPLLAAKRGAIKMSRLSGLLRR